MVSCLLVPSSSTTGTYFKGEKEERIRPASPRCPFPWDPALVSSGGFGDDQSGLRCPSPVRLQNFDEYRPAFPAAASRLPSGTLFSPSLRNGQVPQGKAVGAWAPGRTSPPSRLRAPGPGLSLVCSAAALCFSFHFSYLFSVIRWPDISYSITAGRGSHERVRK